MFKKIVAITVLTLVSTSALFGPIFSASTVKAGIYTAKQVKYDNKYCPDNMTSKKSISYQGGTLTYGCVSSHKPYTEYKKNTSQDYVATTKTPNGTNEGTRRDDNRLSNHSEQTIKSGGTMSHQVRFFG